ncbi:MAG TPA: hypothetical protein PLZ51_02150, partial [Aggregatilineales bacterium]|nr:hypothetical protein [Aggregatilineales bacterium]
TGILLISNTGGGGGTDTPSLTQTRVAVQPTATPESEASPIPGERRDGEEDPDGDTFIGDLDFCPEVAGAFEGCPDTDGDGIGDSKDACIANGDEGYGIDGTGCPNPPTDDDGDGIFDNDDTCRGQGDAGFGVDSVGCPLPNPNPDPQAPVDRDGDGIPDEADACPDDNGGGVVVIGPDGCPVIAIVPDSAPAIFPYRFEGMGGMVCTVTIANIGDADPAILGEAGGLVADGDGVIAGEISILIGPNDTPEAQIGCVPDSAPAIAAISYSF